MSNTVHRKSQEVEKFDSVDRYFGNKIDFELKLHIFLERLQYRTGKKIIKIQRYICGPEGANQREAYYNRRVKVMFEDGEVKRYWYRTSPFVRKGWQIYKAAVKSRW